MILVCIPRVSKGCYPWWFGVPLSHPLTGWDEPQHPRPVTPWFSRSKPPGPLFRTWGATGERLVVVGTNHPSASQRDPWTWKTWLGPRNQPPPAEEKESLCTSRGLIGSHYVACVEAFFVLAEKTPVTGSSKPQCLPGVAFGG